MKQVKGIWFPDDDTHFQLMLNGDGSYQKDTFDMAMEYVRIPKVFYDVGAHVGLWSLMAIKAGFKELHAFEPNKKTFKCLKANLEDKAFLYNQGISSSRNPWMKVVEEKEGNSGAVKLVVNATDSGSDAITLPFQGSLLHEDIARLELKPHETLVKIDTEGMEAECILGMDRILYAFRPVIIVEQRTNVDALKILEQMGMVLRKKVRKDFILTWKNQ